MSDSINQLVSCPDCGKKVSQKAAACPQCGCPQRAIEPVPPTEVVVKQDKSVGCGGMLMVGILGLFIYGLFSGINDDLASQGSTEPKTAQERRADELAKGFSAWTGAHVALQRWVKKRLKDPDSFEHIDSSYVDKGDHLIVTLNYRAKNSFGGYNLESVTAKAAPDGSLLEILVKP